MKGGKGMKRVLKFFLSLILILGITRVKASTIELNYSEWSTLYPSGLDSSFIESEDRYHFYRVQDNQIEYTDEYYTQLEGYIKDEPSKTTFYRYITNSTLVFNAKNELLLDYSDYCKKNFCYVKTFREPTMVDLNSKLEGPDYTNTDMFELNTISAPMTGDNIIFSFIILGISVVCLILLVVKRKKMSYE